jgi:hypothetical protein
MGSQDHAGSGLEAVLDGWQRRPEPAVVGYAAIGQGNVEVGPEEDPLPLEVQLLDAQFAHRKSYSHLAM